MLIPKQFRIGRTRFNVRTVRKLRRRGTMGELDTNTNCLTIATQSNLSGRVFKREELTDTFWHEVTHAILKDMGSEQWDDEHFVTEFSNRLTQVINTAKF